MTKEYRMSKKERN